jgi:hypothetical protein
MTIHDLQYWINEVDEGRDIMETGYIRAGRALWKLHGPKGQKTGQLWKTDSRPTDSPNSQITALVSGLVTAKVKSIIGWQHTKRLKFSTQIPPLVESPSANDLQEGNAF